jgi:hypothetical protein
VNDAERQFAARLAEDLERVLGAGIAIDDVALTTVEGRARVRATLLVEGRVEEIEAAGDDVFGLYRPLIERAAQLRLGAAFWRMVGPS